jgi:hypothetical protein
MSEEYQRTAKALARETEMNPASAARIEQALLTAMASRDAVDLPSRHTWLPPLGGRFWMSAAAAILLVTGALFVWQTSRSVMVKETIIEPTNSKPEASAAPVTENAVEQTQVVPTKRSVTHRQHRIRQTPQRALVINPAGFVELPGSAGLPAFESGEIVRMEVPMASLPAYGIDISAGADRPVEADILIGQDGFARAIRLVTNSARSVQ